MRFLQLNRSRFEQSDSILVAPLIEEALEMKEARLIEREMKPLKFGLWTEKDGSDERIYHSFNHLHES